MMEETIELRGHILDSLMLQKVLDTVLSRGGAFEIQQVDVGVRRSDPSYARVKLKTASREEMDELLSVLRLHGAEPVEAEDARVETADMDGVLPDNFYATTNMETMVRIAGDWVRVRNIEMDRGIVVDLAARCATCTPMHRVKKGDSVVVGHRGVRIMPPQPSAVAEPFGFMASDFSMEKPKLAVVNEVAKGLSRARAEHRKTLFVGGPAIIHTGAGGPLSHLIKQGYINVLFSGNGLAAHDIEHALYGTSLGIRLTDGSQVEYGHRNHLRAINAVRRAGGIRAAIDAGLLTHGVMHACVTCGVPFVLAGSIRDDGPLPDTITDVVRATDAMRDHLKDVEFALVVASTLHAIATGNILPAATRMVVVDINPASLTKLMDRGSYQTVGVVSDSGLFLRQLVECLEKEC